MQKVILETKHESGQVFQLNQLYDNESNEDGFCILRGEYAGEQGRFRELSKWNRLEKAIEEYCDVLSRFLTSAK